MWLIQNKYAYKLKKGMHISKSNHNTSFLNKIIYLNMLNKLTQVKNNIVTTTGISYYHKEKHVLNSIPSCRKVITEKPSAVRS